MILEELDDNHVMMHQIDERVPGAKGRKIRRLGKRFIMICLSWWHLEF